MVKENLLSCSNVSSFFRSLLMASFNQFVRLVAQTGIVSIHGHVRVLDCLWEMRSLMKMRK